MCTCLIERIANDNALRAPLDAGFRRLATRVAWQFKSAHHPGLRPAFGVSLRERETPFGGSAGRLTILSPPCFAWHRSARSCVTARTGFPAPLRSGWWGFAPNTNRCWGSSKRWGVLFVSAPPSQMLPLGRLHCGVGETDFTFYPSLQHELS